MKTGCFCYPGAGEIAFNLPQAALGGMFAVGERLSYDGYLADLGLPSPGALRVSLGVVTNFADVYHFVQIACTFLDHFPESSPL